MVCQIYPTEYQLNKANFFNTEAPILDLVLSITNGIVSSNVYDKRNDFNFGKHVVNLPFLDGDVYISQFIRFLLLLVFLIVNCCSHCLFGSVLSPCFVIQYVLSF